MIIDNPTLVVPPCTTNVDCPEPVPAAKRKPSAVTSSLHWNDGTVVAVRSGSSAWVQVGDWKAQVAIFIETAEDARALARAATELAEAIATNTNINTHSH